MTDSVHSGLEVTGPERLADRIVAALWAAGTVGVEHLADGRLRAYFGTEPAAALVAELVELDPGVTVERFDLAERDWTATSRAFARAVTLGPLVVRPPWLPAPAADALDIVIEPARAFGTGSHESTWLMLAELVATPPRAQGVLDVGSGTGVLAIAALKLGARRATALDLDPEAVAASRANAARNRVEADVVQAGPAAVDGAFELVLANLSRPILTATAGELAARVKPGGELLTAGYLCRDEAAIEALFRPPLIPIARATRGDWLAQRFARRVSRVDEASS